MASDAGGSSGNREEDEIELKPLWRYVTKFGKFEGGGNLSFRCNYCNVTFKGSYSRVKAHLLKIVGEGIRACPKVTSPKLIEMQKLVDESLSRAKSKLPKDVPLPSNLSRQSSSASSVQIGGTMSSLRQESFGPRKRKSSGNSPLERSFNMQAREQLDGEIARMFYSAGLSFNLARNPHFKSSYTMAANSGIAGYVPPSYNAIRTTLLQKERSNVERLLEPIKHTWLSKGVTLVSDGWTDPQRRPLINFMGVTENGPVFIKAANCQGEYKDKFFIANLIKEVILEVGPSNVVQVITDNAPVCRAAGMLIEQAYPHIFWTPCVVHTLNLALKNICDAKNTESNGITYNECHWITEVSNQAVMIKNFIMNHSMRLAMFNEFSHLKLLAVAETRFASVIIMLKRFKLIKSALQRMVISEQWSCYREDDVVRAMLVKDKLLSDIWWDNVDYIIAFTEPIYEMLRLTDTDKACLHLVYELWETMIEKVKAAIYRHEGKSEDEDSSFWEVVRTILEDRWSKSNTPLHCLAYCLNPRYTSKEWQVQNPTRTPPHNDLEFYNMRKNCLKHLFPNEDERRTVMTEISKFYGYLDEFGEFDSLLDRAEMDPKMWWLTHGTPAPLLHLVAIKLLGQVSSSSCCERNWSTYSFIQSMKRNKIQPQRAEDLVYVHTNLRLLSRRSQQYKEGDSKMWDVAGDAFESMDDVGLLEIANLSLDEPDLELDLFNDDDNGEDGLDASTMPCDV